MAASHHRVYHVQANPELLLPQHTNSSFHWPWLIRAECASPKPTAVQLPGQIIYVRNLMMAKWDDPWIRGAPNWCPSQGGEARVTNGYKIVFWYRSFISIKVTKLHLGFVEPKVGRKVKRTLLLQQQVTCKESEDGRNGHRFCMGGGDDGWEWTLL